VSWVPSQVISYEVFDGQSGTETSFSLRVLEFPNANIKPPMTHTHLQLQVALAKRKKEKGLRIFKKT
jgi:hypothetical protein